MVDLNRHPVLKQTHELCLLIEEIPASTRQTELSVAASQLLTAMDEALPQPETAASLYSRSILAAKEEGLNAQEAWDRFNAEYNAPTSSPVGKENPDES